MVSPRSHQKLPVIKGSLRIPFSSHYDLLAVTILAAVTSLLGVISADFLDTKGWYAGSGRQYLLPQIMYAKINEFLKEHHRHSPKGPSDLSELERNSKLLQSFQSDVPGQPSEGTGLHQPPLPAEEFVANLGPHIKTHAINDSRKDSNAKCRSAAISMASITFLVAILNWLLGFIVESRQGGVEIWTASIIIEADRTEIQNEKEDA
ncbi:hypothetical protein TWF106_001703 [Orbilia oligospora]|uniref:Uncharacterized protein n=1 Tax=Orbilia oligospora TaxID=2813651 RepID=A0A7C8QVD0_ORBOL|nr:hypothetical protein TWF106_001703 [Orbilia oligospora]